MRMICTLIIDCRVERPRAIDDQRRQLHQA
jgi:hypothetical protein